MQTIDRAFDLAREQYTRVGVDAEQAIQTLLHIPISLHCWQADDVGGFETPDSELSGGGIQATGNYPGKARTPDELREVPTIERRARIAVQSRIIGGG